MLNSEVLHAQDLHTHEWYCISSALRLSTYQPSWFSGQKGKQAFYFFRPYLNRIGFIVFWNRKEDMPSLPGSKINFFWLLASWTGSDRTLLARHKNYSPNVNIKQQPYKQASASRSIINDRTWWWSLSFKIHCSICYKKKKKKKHIMYNYWTQVSLTVKWHSSPCSLRFQYMYVLHMNFNDLISPYRDGISETW